MGEDNPVGTDETIKKMLQNITPENVDFPSDLRNIKRPRSYNKRKNDNTQRQKSGYEEPVQIQESEHEQVQIQEPEEDSNEQYEEPQQVQQQNTVHEDTRPQVESQFEEIQTATRRSKRIPKLSAKALDMLEYDPWYNNGDN